MALQADLLESIPQTRYLSAESYISYRAIMRIFYLEYQKMHYQLDKDTILTLLHKDPLFVEYTAEQLISDLDQLAKWKNLTPIQDPHKAYTITDFKNRQFQYMMTEAALEVERMTITLENLYTRTTGLSSSAFRRLQAALHTAEHLEGMSLKEIGEWWQELQEDFRRLRQNHQDYLREFYGPNAEKQMKSAEFIAYKQHLIHYLEDFIQDEEAGVPVDEAGRELLRRELANVLKSLTPREERVLTLRFGLEDGQARTLEELGKEFNVTRERIRQIEAKALRKLRHPSRAKRLRDYLEE